MTRAVVRGIGAGLLGALALACGPAPGGRSAPAFDERRDILPEGPPSDFFMAQPVGDSRGENERPQISNVQLVDLDRCPPAATPLIQHRRHGDAHRHTCGRDG